MTNGARMTDGPGSGARFLEFFILEAGDYVEQLDGLLFAAGPAGPDADAIQRVARALRGTATMARIPAFADLSALRDGTVRWDASLRGSMISAIDDLKTLLRAARSWSAAEDRQAQARTADLARFVPARPSAPVTSGASAGAGSYFATEASNIAAGLDLVTTRAGDAEAAANVLRRVRALRSVAGVKEIVPLADALEAIEDAGREKFGGGALSAQARRVLETAAAYLRATSVILRSGGDVMAASPARQAFEQACEAWGATGAERERVVPIAALFYADGRTGLVEASPHPPTSAEERFRLELVGLGEHLRQVVAAARAIPDPASAGRVQREVRRVLHAIEALAVSFSEHDVAEFVRAHAPATEKADFLELNSLEDLASVLAEPGTEGSRLRARLREASGGREIATSIGSGFGRETSPGAATASRRSGAKRGADLGTAALLDSGIAALELISSAPLAPRATIPEEDGPIVPIQSLLYHGRSALDRAVEIRDGMRQSGPPTDPDALEELFDLLELARVE
jgi:chemotaxis protein histidine kinase CheA